MAYRDDLEAALAHATAAEEDLKAARQEIAVDERRIAELEKRLAAAERRVGKAQKGLPTLKPQPPPKPRSNGGFVVVIMAAVLTSAGVLGFFSIRRSSGPSATSGTSFDVSGSMSEALAAARTKILDAELVSLKAAFVTEAGLAQLQYNDEVRYRFRSPSMARQPAPSAPVLGAPVVDSRAPCRVSVYTDSHRSLRAGSTSVGDCGDSPPPSPPTCTVAGLWQRAITDGAPHGALAYVTLKAYRGAWLWHLKIGDQAVGRDVFSRDYDDTCPTASRR